MRFCENRLYLKQADRAPFRPYSRNLVSCLKQDADIERVWELGVEGNIWTEEANVCLSCSLLHLQLWWNKLSDFVYSVHWTWVTEPPSRTAHINLCCMLRMIILSLWGRNINGCTIKRDPEVLLHASTDWVPKLDSCFPVLNQLAFPNLHEVPFLDFLQQSASSTHVVGLEGKRQISRLISVSCYQIVGQDHNVEPVNKSFENVPKLKYQGNRVTEYNYMLTKKT